MTKELKDLILAQCEWNESIGCDMLTDSDLMDIREKYEQMGMHISHKELEAEIDTLLGRNTEIEEVYKTTNSGKFIPVCELIRCKDCKQSGIDSTSYPQYWCSAHTEYHDGNWFCADGEKRS